MTTQPEALRLADGLDAHAREVEQSNGRLVFVALTLQEVSRTTAELRRLVAQRDALLEALKLAQAIIGHPEDAHSQFIAATIARVEGETD